MRPRPTTACPSALNKFSVPPSSTGSRIRRSGSLPFSGRVLAGPPRPQIIPHFESICIIMVDENQLTFVNGAGSYNNSRPEVYICHERNRIIKPEPANGSTNEKVSQVFFTGPGRNVFSCGRLSDYRPGRIRPRMEPPSALRISGLVKLCFRTTDASPDRFRPGL